MTLVLFFLSACAAPEPANPDGAAPPELSAPGSTGPSTEPVAPLSPMSPTPGSAPTSTNPAAQPGELAPGTGTPTVTPTSGGRTPQELYGECRDRLEGEQRAGECASSADCARAGCSQEVCVPASAAGDIMTTCEILPCFQVLDTCGCNEGMCTWALRAETPPTLRRPPSP